MALGEFATRPGFQIAFKAYRPGFVRELDHDMKLPGAEPSCVWATAGIVVVQSCADVRRQTNVVTRSGFAVFQDVDNALRCRHAADGSKPVTMVALTKWAELVRWTEPRLSFLQCGRPGRSQVRPPDQGDGTVARAEGEEASLRVALRRSGAAAFAEPRAKAGGRGWNRTTDPSRVKRMLYR